MFYTGDVRAFTSYKDPHTVIVKYRTAGFYSKREMSGIYLLFGFHGF